MNGGGGDHTLLTSPAADGSDFLLQLLQRPPHQPPLQPGRGASSSTQSENLSHDPAVAAVGPSLPFPQLPSNGHDLSQHPPPWSLSPPFAPHNFFLQGFPQNPNSSPNHNWSSPGAPPQPNLPPNYRRLDDERKLGFSGSSHRAESTHQHDRNIMFGTFPSEIRSNEGTTNGNAAPGGRFDGLLPRQRENREVNWGFNGLESNLQNSINYSRVPPANFQDSRNSEQDRRIGVIGGRGRQPQSEGFRGGASSPEVRRPPPGFLNKPSNFGKLEPGNRSFERNVNNRMNSYGESNHMDARDNRFLHEHGKIRGDMPFERRLSSQLESPGPPAGSNLHSVSASDFEDSLTRMHAAIGENRLRDDVPKDGDPVHCELDNLAEHIEDSLVLEDGSAQKSDGKQRQHRDKDYRSDTRGQRVLGQKMRHYKRQDRCRSDIDRLSPSFLAIFEALIPPDEEKARQKQLMTLLEKLVKKEWPDAQLYLYGSCANSFGVSKSDIDVCLRIEDPELDKCEVLLKLADILQSDALQNVQALTRARVPIVKLMDPVTGISCDICINNVLAVVNTKLLRDYAKIDARLQQLAYIVKHWAKSRRVNETYHGTLSSYAYVLMCIHFLQQRRPAILPCLQGMDVTYAVTVDNIECSFFDQVEKLSAFGSRNRESIAQLVWGFFNYWAYCHDYTNDVISVRTGCTISKRLKDWTRRIGNDRHLICIEDPFEVSHDLGRVVDKFSIKVLREEFERAAEIMQYDPNPCVTLFEPYDPRS